MNETSLFTGESDDGTFVPFTDILFNALLGFAVMLFIAFALIKPDDKVGNINVKAEFLITVTWPDNLADDIDTYVRDPQDNIVWYNTLDRGFLHLDRDDRGEYLDQVMVNGETVTFPLNQETVTLRGIIPGEYTVNVYNFLNPSNVPVPVSVKVEKLNPTVKVIYYQSMNLNGVGDEKTAIRFTLDSEGNVSNLNDIQDSLVEAVRAPK
ncbi:MAG: hypothetical protein J0I48_07665 [Devosia sp.]|uniref:hypothetical protein n=1 Tax=unclassified Devosia TaxID=196773 RepID=UPI00092B098F|nr:MULTISPECIES: hypothetical protein [unclassified Devosia]MBL8596265.1 hypothetical protein [Devosia sp.]MBN9346065.1 hypothetical protein [Devosia sp.]OJX51412.1 MAG: hypothetical protein BGO81_12120 [Devosia sp. 66-22]